LRLAPYAPHERSRPGAAARIQPNLVPVPARRLRPRPNTPVASQSTLQQSNLTWALRARALRAVSATPPPPPLPSVPALLCSAPTDGRTDGPAKTRDSVLRPNFHRASARPRLLCTAPTRPTPLAGPQAAQVSPVSVATAKSAKASGKCSERGGKIKKGTGKSAGAAPSKVSAPAADAAGLGRSRSPQPQAGSPSPSPGFSPATTGLPGSSVPVAALCSYRSPVRPALGATTIHGCKTLEHVVYRTAQPLWEQEPARVQTRTTDGIHRPQIERPPLLAVAVVHGLPCAVPVGGVGSSSTIRQKRLEDAAASGSLLTTFRSMPWGRICGLCR